LATPPRAPRLGRSQWPTSLRARTAGHTPRCRGRGSFGSRCNNMAEAVRETPSCEGFAKDIVGNPASPGYRRWRRRRTTSVLYIESGRGESRWGRNLDVILNHDPLDKTSLGSCDSKIGEGRRGVASKHALASTNSGCFDNPLCRLQRTRVGLVCSETLSIGVVDQIDCPGGPAVLVDRNCYLISRRR